ncbi:MFS general substrate transporter-30 [Coleophoma cylindrospora]|uniref:MFS general substrate transporter-30 n=1 Tax=Coleophoma cylindrospora TaxID=1849047 RepID=A0A3D8QCT1_9HELO|nr:MFS general substrate transporter-30 [Coleophoma cylindrospora]
MAFDDAEKNGVSHIDRTISAASTDACISQFSPQEQKQIIRRVDRRLVPVLGLLYCVSLVDRTNLGAANIAGMAKDLSLTGSRYNLIVLIFFIPYVMCQPPTTVITRKLGPRKFISAITLLWGGCMVGFGFVKQWEQLLGLRILLGVLEAGFFPGCAYLLSTWYTRYELLTRNTVFYLICSVLSAGAGILAYGLMQMDGLSGLAGWRWIFIIEGIITCCLGIVAYFLIVDFPEHASKSWHFLSERESQFMVARIEMDRHDAIPTTFNIRAYLSNAMDLKIWAFAAIFGLTTTNTYAIAYFLPVILKVGMGFGIAASQCLVAPPALASAIVMYGFAILGDKYHIRGPIIAFNAILGLIGIPLLGFAKSSAVRYFGVFLVTVGANGNVPTILTFSFNNIRGQWKRALCSAALVSFGGIGGIIGGTVFREQDAPKYRPGIETTMIANALVLVGVGLLTIKFYRANQRAERGEEVIEGQEGFRYTL